MLPTVQTYVDFHRIYGPGWTFDRKLYQRNIEAFAVTKHKKRFEHGQFPMK